MMATPRNKPRSDDHSDHSRLLLHALLVGELLVADALLVTTILFLVFLMLPAPIANVLAVPLGICRTALQSLAGWFPY